MNFPTRAAVAAVLAFASTFAFSGVLPGPIVDVEWLAANRDRVQVVDVRSSVKSFATEPVLEADAASGKRDVAKVGGHIAGARLIDLAKVRSERKVGARKLQFMIPDKAGFEKLVQAAGVEQGKPIVVLSAGNDVSSVDEALRLYWQFKVFGEDDIAVLNGGMAQWLVEGKPHTLVATAPQRGDWVAKADRGAQYLANSDDVAAAIRDKTAALVDARDARLFHGLAKRDYVDDFGHLENAKLYPTDILLKTTRGAALFMSHGTYRRLMIAQDIDPATPSITYCNSGHLAAGPWFILAEVLGARSARLYDGSLHAWTAENRPTSGAAARD